MSRLRGAVRLGIASVAVGCALAITGCGGEEDPAVGTATVLMAGGPDYLDPQLAHTREEHVRVDRLQPAEDALTAYLSGSPA